MSLQAAKNKLKPFATDVLCLHYTFYKKNPLCYQTLAETVIAHVSLRSTHNVLSCGNLVRQQTTKDPKCGERRGMQLCTLPITLDGLPMSAQADWAGVTCLG